MQEIRSNFVQSAATHSSHLLDFRTSEVVIAMNSAPSTRRLTPGESSVCGSNPSTHMTTSAEFETQRPATFTGYDSGRWKPPRDVSESSRQLVPDCLTAPQLHVAVNVTSNHFCGSAGAAPFRSVRKVLGDANNSPTSRQQRLI